MTVGPAAVSLVAGLMKNLRVAAKMMTAWPVKNHS
jgi:hypothetical protein